MSSQLVQSGCKDVPSPLGVFSEVFILKGFKSCVLEVRNPKGLRTGFAEVRIVKDLVTGDSGLVSRDP